MSEASVPHTLEQLEALVPRLIEKIRRLEDVQSSLTEETDRLKTELESTHESLRNLQAENRRLAQLETSQQEYQSERAQIRTRVAGLLEQLENTDFL